MIHYTLKCDQGHCFDSWFQSADAFETLRSAGHLSCSECGSANVEKAIMAPRVTAARDRATPAKVRPAPPPAAGKTTEDTARDALAEMKRQVEANATYVGGDFVGEARAQHLGEAPERPIYGEAKPQDAKSLLEDGVPVLPLPFTPTRKTN